MHSASGSRLRTLAAWIGLLTAYALLSAAPVQAQTNGGFLTQPLLTPPAPPVSVYGQSFPMQVPLQPATRNPLLATRQPSTIPPDSLPANMPLNTRIFWGNHGLFRTLGLAPEHRSGELALRNGMLKWHQRLGLLTWGMFTTQVILGQLIYSNPADHYENLLPVHRTLGYTTWGTYLGTASLSLLAPPARRYGGGVSSVKIHRYLAIIHFAGMMAQPWLGRAIANQDNIDDFNRLRNLHRTVGWVTYGAFTAAIVTIFLPL